MPTATLHVSHLSGRRGDGFRLLSCGHVHGGGSSGQPATSLGQPAGQSPNISQLPAVPLVLLSAGMFAFRRSLLSIGAVGNVNWSFSLDYLAGNGVDGIIGKGFNFPQSLHLELLPGGDVQMASGQNTLELFLQTSPGVYAAAPGNNTRAELYRSGSGSKTTSSRSRRRTGR